MTILGRCTVEGVYGNGRSACYYGGCMTVEGMHDHHMSVYYVEGVYGEVGM